jgi:uncharacterized membrane protein (UPF0182 family)
MLPARPRRVGAEFGLDDFCLYVCQLLAVKHRLGCRRIVYDKSESRFSLRSGRIEARECSLRDRRAPGRLFRIVVILLLGLATWVFLGNYALLFNSHAFMTGADYVDQKVTLPLRWLLIIAVLAALPLTWTSRYKKAIALLIAAFIVKLVLPGIVRAVYVRPNEISIERPYIERHIQASTVAFGLNRSATERPFTASGQETVDALQDATLLDNVRLWDLRAYNATITQIQALRPYYTFPDTDVDRYFINGRIKQVLLSPRDIDVRQLSAEARQSWINLRFIYTYGFGVGV